MPYAPGLDGVRALAIAAVLLYHARVPWLPGGFLGVDVFFVLSGYLITSLLLSERRHTGRIALGRFWAGRARRLLPAAVVVIGVCVCVEVAYVHGDLHRLRAEAVSSLFYVNNWQQIFASHSYFDAFTRPSLLEHFWSLSVEEQFYLVWPLVLAAGLAVGGRRWVLRFAFATACLSAGVMAALYHPAVDPSRVYYGTDTRAGSLMIGAIMAFGWPLGRLTRNVGPGVPMLVDALGAGALGVLVLLMHTWHDHDPIVYQGGLFIVAGAAAMLIGVAVHPVAGLSRGLGARPLRWLGQRSYGIYLWHWPVMALTRPGIDVPWSSTLVVALQIGLTLTLAELSYRWVEMPVRRGDAQRRLRRWWGESSPNRRLISGTGLATVAGAAALSAIILPSLGGPARGPLPTAMASASSSTAGRSGYITGPSASPRPALAVGSSQMLAARPILSRRLPVWVDAAAGRSSAAVIHRLEAYRRAGRLPSTVIVHVGEVDPLSSTTMPRLKGVLEGVPHVVLVDRPTAGATWARDLTGTLERAAVHWPGAIIAGRRSSGTGSISSSNPVPLGSNGPAEYAGLIGRTLDAVAAHRTVHGLRATVVSDSVGETVAETPSALRALNRGLSLRLDLMVCRRLVMTSCTFNGVTPPPALEVITSIGRRLGPIVVIDVGYNDDSDRYRSGIDRVMRAALHGGAREVIWVTLREFGNDAATYRATNAAIREASRRWRQLRIADWNRYSAGQAWFADDVHPSARGAVALARFLRFYITTSTGQ